MVVVHHLILILIWIPVPIVTLDWMPDLFDSNVNSGSEGLTMNTA